jgi:type IV secretory pathway VirB10-like protein
MSNSDDLDDVFGPLRSTATRAEIANEASAVDAMAHAHNASKGRITMLNSRKARVATLIAAGIIGFGGIAAAGPGGFQSLEVPEDPVETTIATTVPDEPENKEPETTTETTGVPESSAVATTEDPPEEPADVKAAKVPEAPVEPAEEDPDRATVFNESTCLDGNHGKSVSAAARDDEEFEGQNADESDVEVRDVAHSSCGKQSDAEHEEETEAEKAAEAEESDDGDHESDDDGDESDDDDDDDHDEKAEKPAKKNGNSASKDKGSNGRGKNKKGD